MTAPVLNRTTAESIAAAERWSYAAPNYSPSNPHDAAAPHAVGHARVLALLEAAAGAGAKIRADAMLTAAGRRDRFTREVAAVQLPQLDTFRAALEADATRVENDAAALMEAAEGAVVSDHATAVERMERLALGQAFAQLTGPARQVALEDVIRGQDPQLARALAYVHPIITGIPVPMRNTLRGDDVAARVDAERMHALRLEGHRLDVSLRLVATAERALLDASDLDQLTADGLLPQRPDAMTTDEKVAYIREHGPGAFAALTERFARPFPQEA